VILKKCPRLLALVALTFSLCITMTASNVSAQSSKKYLSASQSDPVKMGWMQGFPPPQDKILKAGDGSFFEFPALRYTVAHMRQFLPTINVSRGNKAATILPEALDENIEALTFQPTNSKQMMTWQASLEENYTDGILILHRGKIVYERYFGALNADVKHVAMSVTKNWVQVLPFAPASFTSTGSVSTRTAFS
jgi:hypothetical protein